MVNGNKKKGMFVGLSMVLLLSACTGGGGSTETETPKDDGETKAPAAEEPAAEPAPEKFEISMFKGVWAAIPPNDGEGLKAINERFNVDFKPQLVPMGEAEQKLSVLMASGDIPDIVGFESPSTNFYQWAGQGAFLPLNEYFESGEYETLNLIPDNVLAKLTVDGNIYAIPQYFRVKYRNSPLIRKDWLDKLGLPMPTNYSELLAVSKAFTEQDPDGNGQNDTYGFAMSSGIDNEMQMGAYYDSGTWLHKNDKGQLIPGIISNGSKERIQFLRDAYAGGYVHKDWPIMTYQDARNLFWTGKAGIYYEGTPGGKGLFEQLAAADPNAVIEPLPPFVAPDGSQGYQGLSGFYLLHTLSAELADQPEKVKRILEMTDFFATFIPKEQANPDNPDYDWKWGGLGKGYDFVDGKRVLLEEGAPKRPQTYFMTAEWAPNDEAVDMSSSISTPLQQAYVDKSVEMWSKPNFVYIDPTNSINSELFNTKYWELHTTLIDEQTKMIIGDQPMDAWEPMVESFLSNGGQDVIDEVNAKIAEAGVEGRWQ